MRLKCKNDIQNLSIVSCQSCQMSLNPLLIASLLKDTLSSPCLIYLLNLATILIHYTAEKALMIWNHLQSRKLEFIDLYWDILLKCRSVFIQTFSWWTVIWTWLYCLWLRLNKHTYTLLCASIQSLLVVVLKVRHELILRMLLFYLLSFTSFHNIESVFIFMII